MFIRNEYIKKVYSLDEFFEFVYKKFNNSGKEYDSNYYFFRGQSDYSWALEPGIRRESNKKEWEELNGIVEGNKDLFSYIAKLQHYQGRKTRFLDFTTNIDVALYFACESENSIDASVYICSYTPRKMSWCDVEIISELSFLKNEILVNDFSENLLDKYESIRNKYEDTEQLSMSIASWIDHGFMVLPSKDEYEKLNKEGNQRICNQEGAFFICGNNMKHYMDGRDRWQSNAGKNIIRPEVAEVPNTIKYGYGVFKIIIPSNLKQDALEYLKTKKSIDKDYIYVE